MSMIFRIRYLSTIILLHIFCAAFPAEKLVLKTGVELGDSYTINFIGGGFIIPQWDVANNIELSGGLKITNEEKRSVFLSDIVKFPLKNCELRIMDKFLCNKYNAWNMQEFLFFTGLGIAVRHFDGMLGISYRVMTRTDSFKESIFEPFNIQYDLGVSPQLKTGNMRFGISNYDIFLFERMENIIFSLKGDYPFSNRWKFFCGISMRPAGNFNFTAQYYMFYIQTGIQWAVF